MDEALIKKIPPHSVEAERAVIGSMMMDKDAILVSSEILSAEDFYQGQYGELFTALVELYRSGVATDLVTLQNKLREMDTVPELSSTEFLANLTLSVPTSANIKHYADIVHEKAVLRRLIQTTEKEVFDVLQQRSASEFEPISQVVLKTLDEISQAAKQDGHITGLETGFYELDYKTAGLQKSDLILIAARPAMGKTAFALNLVQNAALKGDASVAVFSLEMSKEQLVQRMIASQSTVELKKIKTGTLADNDWPRITDGMAILSGAKIHIDDTPGIKISELRSKCRKLKIEKGLDLVLIDYLQLMEGEGQNESRQQEIAKISRSLKILAKELDCPVVALSQLSRAPEQRADHRPMLSDLRESGSIEQDADIVMFLYRDEYYNPDTEKKNIGEVIVAKNRHGETGTVELVWFGGIQKFADKMIEQ